MRNINENPMACNPRVMCVNWGMKNEENPPMKTVEDVLRFLKSEALKFGPGETKCQLKEAIELIESCI